MNFFALCLIVLLNLSSQLRNLQYSSFFPSNMSPQSKNQIESDDCQIFCLQPDSRLCQCSKEELNKYIPLSSFDLSSSEQNATTTIETKSNHTSSTLPHIYQSQKDKQTCGEYSLSIRKLNIALSTPKPSSYFEPTIDFQIMSPSNHSVSSLFQWGDFAALYNTNPYINYTHYLPGCSWQIPSGESSYHSTIESKSCRKSIFENVSKEEKGNMHLCIWSYERYWKDLNSGPCLCCEVNFDSCKECYKCFKESKEEEEGDDKIQRCLGEENLDCYKCLNFKIGSYNCQNYEYFLMNMIKEAKGHNKYNILTKNQKTLLDNL